MTPPPDLTVTLAINLGSLAVHVEEMLEDPSVESVANTGATLYDLAAIRQLLTDSEVEAFRASMDALGLLPVKRGG